MSFFSSITPRVLPDGAFVGEVRHHTRCYLVWLIGGTLFTNHSGGSIHPMFLHFVRDLNTCGEYAWGATVLIFLYRELCKGCKTDTELLSVYCCCSYGYGRDFRHLLPSVPLFFYMMIAYGMGSFLVHVELGGLLVNEKGWGYAVCYTYDS